MKNNIKVEVEDKEMAIRSSTGAIAIIPKDKVSWVKEKIESGCHDCIDKFVASLPTQQSYAEDGSLFPDNKVPKIEIDPNAPPGFAEVAPENKEQPAEVPSYTDGTPIDVPEKPGTNKTTLRYTGLDNNYDVKSVAKRTGARQNPDGTVSTHIMASAEADGKYFAYPTLFQDKEGNWIEKDDKNDFQALKEARKRGEVFEFKTQEEAQSFANGSWKKNYKEYNTNSKEYDDIYPTAMGYDNRTDRMIAPVLDQLDITAEKPLWMKAKDIAEKEYPKEKFIKEALPSFSKTLGVTPDNLSPQNVQEYERRINDKIAEKVLEKYPSITDGNSSNALKIFSSLSDKEKEIIGKSKYASKLLPGIRANNLYQADIARKNFSVSETLMDANKFAQSTQGVADKFRLFPNAQNSIEDALNPYLILGNMAKGLGEVPKDIKNEDYGKVAASIGVPLTLGALGGFGAKTTGQFLNNSFNPLAGIKDMTASLSNNLNKEKGVMNEMKEKSMNMLETLKAEGQTIPKKLSPFYQVKATKELEKANKWQEEWYNNPKTRERLIKLKDEYQKALDKEDLVRKITSPLEETIGKTVNPWEKIIDRIDDKAYISSFQPKKSKVFDFLTGKERLHKGNSGVSGYNLDGLNPKLRQNFVDKYGSQIESDVAHEGNHGVTDGNRYIGKREREALPQIFGEDKKIPIRNEMGVFNSVDEYFEDPTEIYARIMEIRKDFKLKPGDIIDDFTIEMIMKKGLAGKTSVHPYFFQKIKDVELLRQVMNHLPAVVPGYLLLKNKDKNEL